MQPQQVVDLLIDLGLGKVKYVESRKVVVALCPYHDDRVVPSLGFLAHLDGHPGNCFAGCFRGTLLRFVSEYLGIDRKTARKRIEQHGYYRDLSHVPRVSFDNRMRTAAQSNIPVYNLTPSRARASRAYRYLRENHGIDLLVSERARIGYDRNRPGVVFPWFVGKKLTGVTLRPSTGEAMKSEPLFQTRKAQTIYLPFGIIDPLMPIITVEGETDALKVATFGWENVAAWGWADPRRGQIKTLLDLGVQTIIPMGDNDSAGRLGNEKLIQLVRRSIKVQEIHYQTHYTDPEALTHEEFWELLQTASSIRFEPLDIPPHLR